MYTTIGSRTPLKIQRQTSTDAPVTGSIASYSCGSHIERTFQTT